MRSDCRLSQQLQRRVSVLNLRGGMAGTLCCREQGQVALDQATERSDGLQWAFS